MYKKVKYPKSSIKRRNTTEGEPIEHKVERIQNNKEPIKDGAPLIYTERKDGVLAGYDIRSDRFEVATEAMDKVHKSEIAQRMARHGLNEKPTIKLNPEGESAESTT